MTGENLRTMLGYCLFEVRFPLMPVQVFSGLVAAKEVLTQDEELTVLEYMSLTGDQKLV